MERIHYIAQDGRTFTMDEWAAYLKEHDSRDVYRTVEGFEFNVHGVCLNPHIIVVGPPEKRLNGIMCYFDLQTYRRERGRVDLDPEIVWHYKTFDMNCGAHAYGHMEPGATEKDAILKCLQVAAESCKSKLEWYENADARHRINWPEEPTMYGAPAERCRRMLEYMREEYDRQTQLSLFD